MRLSEYVFDKGRCAAEGYSSMRGWYSFCHPRRASIICEGRLGHVRLRVDVRDRTTPYNTNYRINM